MTDPEKHASWVTTRELLALVGYIKTQTDVSAIKESFVSRDQLQIEVQKALNISGLQAAGITALTDQVKANNDQIEQLTIELKAMRLEWSHYRGHR